MAVNILSLADSADLIDGFFHCTRYRHAFFDGFWLLNHFIDTHGPSHTPTTIAPACAEANRICFKYGDIQVRFCFIQIIGGPKTCKPSTYYCNVNLRWQLFWWFRRGKFIQRCKPETAVVIGFTHICSLALVTAIKFEWQVHPIQETVFSPVHFAAYPAFATASITAES